MENIKIDRGEEIQVQSDKYRKPLKKEHVPPKREFGVYFDNNVVRTEVEETRPRIEGVPVY